MTITEIQTSTSGKEQQLIAGVEAKLKAFIDNVKPSSNSQLLPVNNKSEQSSKTKALSFVSIGIAAVGAIGWFSSDALWAKICVGGGLSLFLFDTFINNGKKKSENTILGPYTSQEELPQLKISCQNMIESLSSAIEKEWNKMTSENKNSLFSLIEESKASADEKFKASNIASLPKRINFSLLPYIKNIVGAENTDAIISIVKEMGEGLIASIKQAVSSQEKDYKEIEKLISTQK